MIKKTELKTQENLVRLADHLLLNRSEIINGWRNEARQDDQLAVVNGLSRKEFLDHVPQILDLFDSQIRLAAEDLDFDRADATARKMELHGISRWQQGFSIKEVVRDWNHLRISILEAITKALPHHPEWLAEAFPEAARIVADLIAEGVNHSVSKYEEIRQAEARTQMIELQQNIDDLNQITKQQSARYQELRHDLKGHLGILSALANSYGASAKNEKKLGQLYEALTEGLDRSMHILEDIKIHASLEAHRENVTITKFNVSDLILSSIKPYHALAAEKDLKLEVEGPDQLELKSDSSKVGRVLQNLFHNALKFTQEGTITIHWGTSEDNKFCTVRVSNNGVLSPTVAVMSYGTKLVSASASSPTPSSSKEIDPTSNQHKSHQNLSTSEDLEEPAGFEVQREGIGLSISKRLCELIGARLSVESSPENYGVVANLVLPLHDPD